MTSPVSVEYVPTPGLRAELGSRGLAVAERLGFGPLRLFHPFRNGTSSCSCALGAQPVCACLQCHPCPLGREPMRAGSVLPCSLRSTLEFAMTGCRWHRAFRWYGPVPSPHFWSRALHSAVWRSIFWRPLHAHIFTLRSPTLCPAAPAQRPLCLPGTCAQTAGSCGRHPGLRMHRSAPCCTP